MESATSPAAPGSFSTEPGQARPWAQPFLAHFTDVKMEAQKSNLPRVTQHQVGKGGSQIQGADLRALF